MEDRCPRWCETETPRSRRGPVSSLSSHDQENRRVIKGFRKRWTKNNTINQIERLCKRRSARALRTAKRRFKPTRSDHGSKAQLRDIGYLILDKLVGWTKRSVSTILRRLSARRLSHASSCVSIKACSLLRLRVSIVQRGALKISSTRPITASAVLMGTGLVSMKSPLKRGRSA